jgi:hypothetical protein
MIANGPEPATPSESPDRLLQQLAEQATEYGLQVRGHRPSGVLTEIAIVNPQDPGLGRVVMSCDGFFTWERFCLFRTADDVRPVAQAIGVLLDENMSGPPVAEAFKAQPRERPDRRPAGSVSPSSQTADPPRSEAPRPQTGGPAQRQEM